MSNLGVFTISILSWSFLVIIMSIFKTSKLEDECMFDIENK